MVERNNVKIKLIAIIALMVLVMTACLGAEDAADSGSATGQEIPTSTPIPTAPVAARPTYVVQRGNVEDIFSFSGRWQSRDQMDLAFDVNGTIRQVNVRRGDAVSAGNLLADYDVINLEDQLASAELNLETALANQETGADSDVQSIENAEISLANARVSLQNTLDNAPWTSVASARANLESAEQSLEDAQRSYEDALSHPEQGAATVDNTLQALVNAQDQVESAEISYFSAAQTYNNYQYTIQQAENSVVQAELSLQHARESQNSASSDDSVQSAQLSIDQIQADIDRSSLYAPIDGVILEVYISPGDQIAAFDTVIVIGIPEPKEVIASLAIGDAQRLSIGMLGICEVINQPESAVQCVVRTMPLTSQDADQTTRVAASLENVPDGQLIEVQMPLEISENVLWLPPSVIRTFQNRTFVVLETPDGPRTVDIELGLQTDDRVEIISGVNEGDVAIAP